MVFEELDEFAWCRACDTLQAKYLVPSSGEQGPVPLCNLCAHLVAMHGATVENVGSFDDCGCPDHLVFLSKASDENTHEDGN